MKPCNLTCTVFLFILVTISSLKRSKTLRLCYFCWMSFRILILIYTLICISISNFASTVSGAISDKEGNPLPFATVFVKNSTTGVSANEKGEYFLELKPGNYILIYSYMGFSDEEKPISIRANQHIYLNISLKKDFSTIDEVEIIADKIDRAKQIMSNVRENRKIYSDNVNSYSSKIYSKTSFEKEYPSKDTIKDEKDNITGINDYLQKDKLNLTEYIANAYYKKPYKYTEHVIAYHDFSEDKPPGRSITIQVDIDDNEIAPRQYAAKNPYLFEVTNMLHVFNLYNNLIDIPQLCSQPIKSPIGSASGIQYNYEYIESFFEDDVKIYKLRVIPANSHDALFYGSIFIEDSTFALVAADLFINEKALLMHKHFHLYINYDQIQAGVYLPVKLDILYTIQERKKTVYGETSLSSIDYKVNIEIDKTLFSNELKTFEDDAYEKDSVFWFANRPVELRPAENTFILKTDSIKRYYESNAFLDEQDSIFNRLYWYTPLAGWGRKNHYRGTEFLIGGIFEQVVPFGIGGYRHRIPFYFNKEFSNGMLLETKQTIDYGFKNNDLKGKFGLGLTYFPKKFVRTFIEIGNTYDLINNYASIEQVFSRSNFVNTKSFEIKQRMEVFNGMFAEALFLFSNQLPINNLELSRWSEYIFGDLNEPTEFEQYIKSEFKLVLKYRVNQKFEMRSNKKVIIGKDYPEIRFIWRKGVPGLFNSEVNFDYLELGAKAEHQLARFGDSRWEVLLGSFINKNNLRLLEYKYFRGSDRFFFSDPLRSFQLLGPTLNTNYAFWQANYIHHFNGTILNKLPLIRNLKLGLTGGAGVLNIPEESFYHVEFFTGLERIVRIREQLFRFGIYAVTADNTLSNADFTLKFGISFFNSYTKKWTY